MPSSKVAIVNMALSHIGIAKEISNFDTEQSQEASCARRYYDVALETVLRDFHWPFATVIATLALIELTPNAEWEYSYRYPVDCLTLRRIPSGIRNEDKSTQVPYRLGKDSAGRIIWTDVENAKIEYTGTVTDPTLFPPDFVLAFSYYLGSMMAPRLTGGDPFNLKDKTLKSYYAEISKAAANSFNEEKREEPPDSEFITIRG
jgi:hypothetical protein